MPSGLRIAIVGINYAPEEIGIGRYSTDMAVSLVAQGHQVEMVAGKPYYPAWRIPDEWRGGGWRHSVEQGVTITRCPHYVPSQPNGLRRLIHLASFSASALWPAMRLALRPRGRRPEVVMCIAPSMMSVPVAWLSAKLAGAKLWVHIQDFEVEAAFATGLVSEHGRFARFARWGENKVLALADIASSISPQMCAKLRDKGLRADQVVEIRNWADSTCRFTSADESPYRQEWGIGDRQVCLYSGNIANKQGIEIIIEVARLLAHRRDLIFVICGQGPNRARLEDLAHGLDNIQFHDLQPMERVGELLSLAAIHVLPQIPGAADLVLPSKLTNMLASGRPVVATAEAGTGLYDEVEGCGINTEPGDAPALAGAIDTLLNDPALARRYGAEAVIRAAQRWSRQGVIAKLIDHLDKLAKHR